MARNVQFHIRISGDTSRCWLPAKFHGCRGTASMATFDLKDDDARDRACSLAIGSAFASHPFPIWRITKRARVTVAAPASRLRDASSFIARSKRTDHWGSEAFRRASRRASSYRTTVKKHFEFAAESGLIEKSQLYPARETGWEAWKEGWNSANPWNVAANPWMLCGSHASRAESSSGIIFEWFLFRYFFLLRARPLTERSTDRYFLRVLMFICARLRAMANVHIMAKHRTNNIEERVKFL